MPIPILSALLLHLDGRAHTAIALYTPTFFSSTPNPLIISLIYGKITAKIIPSATRDKHSGKILTYGTALARVGVGPSSSRNTALD